MLLPPAPATLAICCSHFPGGCAACLLQLLSMTQFPLWPSLGWGRAQLSLLWLGFGADFPSPAMRKTKTGDLPSGHGADCLLAVQGSAFKGNWE